MNNNTDHCSDPEFVDASFCTGPSEPSRAELPYSSIMGACGPEDEEPDYYADVALSEGSHTVIINGEVVDQITLTRDDVSSEFGLRAFNYRIDDVEGSVSVESEYEGDFYEAGGTYDLSFCSVAVEADPEVLPETGIADAGGLLAIALSFVLIGGVLRRWV